MTTITQQFVRSDIPEMHPGDTVRVRIKIKEGEKERVGAFEGMLIARKHGSGISATMTVRKVVGGIGVERVFPIHSPVIKRIEVVARASARRAKLYYIREKAAREIRKRMRSIRVEVPVAPVVAAAPEESPAESTEDSAQSEQDVSEQKE